MRKWMWMNRAHFEPLFITTRTYPNLQQLVFRRDRPSMYWPAASLSRTRNGLTTGYDCKNIQCRKSEKIFSYWRKTMYYTEETSFNLHGVIYTHHSPCSPNANRFQVESLLFLWTLKKLLLSTLSVFPISYHTFRVQSFNDLDYYVELNP